MYVPTYIQRERGRHTDRQAAKRDRERRGYKTERKERQRRQRVRETVKDTKRQTDR